MNYQTTRQKPPTPERFTFTFRASSPGRVSPDIAQQPRLSQVAVNVDLRGSAPFSSMKPGFGATTHFRYQTAPEQGILERTPLVTVIRNLAGDDFLNNVAATGRGTAILEADAAAEGRQTSMVEYQRHIAARAVQRDAEESET